MNIPLTGTGTGTGNGSGKIGRTYGRYNPPPYPKPRPYNPRYPPIITVKQNIFQHIKLFRSL